MSDSRAGPWSLAGDNRYSTPPLNASSSVLTAEQKGAKDTLVSLCIGDENMFNMTTVAAWAAWSRLMREQVKSQWRIACFCFVLCQTCTCMQGYQADPCTPS